MIRLESIIHFSLIKNLFKTTSIYAIGNMVSKVIPFLMLPILTRFLTPEDYGIFAIFIATTNVVQMFISMGTISALVRSYFDIGKKGFNYSEFIFNGLFINAAIFAAVFFLWCLGKPYLVEIIPIPFKYQILIPVISFFAVVYSIPLKLWVFKKKPIPYVVFNFTNISLEVSLSVFLIVVLGFGWQGRVFGIALSRLVFFAIGVYLLLKYDFRRVSLNKKNIKEILNYGFPVTLHSSGFVIIALIDRFFLNKFIGLSTTGIYSVSYSICSLIGFMAGAFSSAWVPIFYERLERGLSWTAKIKMVKLTYIYFGIVFLGTFLFIKFIPYIVNVLIGKDFLESKVFIFWLALGFGFHGMYIVVAQYIFYARKTYILSKIAVITVILSFLSNYILIKINGAIGVAQATCLVFLCRFLLVWYYSSKVYPLPWFSFNKQVADNC